MLIVGHSHGRCTIHGLLASNRVSYLKKNVHYELNALPVINVECYLFQIHVSCIGEPLSISQVAPIQHQRQHSHQQLMNPILYRVTTCGEKFHLDQNEKVVMYGTTHVVARWILT